MRYHVSSLGSLLANDKIKCHLVSLVEDSKTLSRYCCEVDEDILSILGRYESIPLLDVKPFDDTVGQRIDLLYRD